MEETSFDERETLDPSWSLQETERQIINDLVELEIQNNLTPLEEFNALNSLPALIDKYESLLFKLGSSLEPAALADKNEQLKKMNDRLDRLEERNRVHSTLHALKGLYTAYQLFMTVAKGAHVDPDAKIKSLEEARQVLCKIAESKQRLVELGYLPKNINGSAGQTEKWLKEIEALETGL